MKVLHINSYYSVSGFYKNLYDQQINNNLDIDVFVPVAYGYENNKFDFGTYTTVSPSYTKYDRLLFHLKHFKILRDIFKTYDVSKYELIHAHSLFSNGYIAMRLNKQYGIPYVVAVRNTDVNVFFKKMLHLRKIGINILNNAESIIFLSDAYREEVIDKYIPNDLKTTIYAKTIILPNGIDNFWFENSCSSKKIEGTQCLKLIYVGALNNNKNVVTTIKAIENLKEEGYEINLKVIGKIENQSLYNSIRDLEYVQYMEYKPKEQLLDIYRECDIFVMPSICESFGLVYAEAMSQGLPIIYSRGQGFDKQFEEGEVGYSVDCYNYKEIALKIKDISKRYYEISSNNIKLCKKFDWKSIERQYNLIYRKIYDEKAVKN